MTDWGAVPSCPTSEQCSAREQVEIPGSDVRAHAVWWPQMGGYSGRAVVTITDCATLWLWHDSQFPIKDDQRPREIHLCDPQQWIDVFQWLHDEVDAEINDGPEPYRINLPPGVTREEAEAVYAKIIEWGMWEPDPGGVVIRTYEEQLKPCEPIPCPPFTDCALGEGEPTLKWVEASGAPPTRDAVVEPAAAVPSSDGRTARRLIYRSPSGRTEVSTLPDRDGVHLAVLKGADRLDADEVRRLAARLAAVPSSGGQTAADMNRAARVEGHAYMDAMGHYMPVMFEVDPDSPAGRAVRAGLPDAFSVAEPLPTVEQALAEVPLVHLMEEALITPQGATLRQWGDYPHGLADSPLIVGLPEGFDPVAVSSAVALCQSLGLLPDTPHGIMFMPESADAGPLPD